MDTYKTTDIILASFLRLSGYQMIQIELNGSKGTFCFEQVDDDILTEYDLGNCRVEPVTFNNTIKQLTTSVRRMNRS
jgi:hypothetical protein